MSSFEDMIREVYPHEVIIVQDATRPEITAWCIENGILECDITILFQNRIRIGWRLRLVHMDDWVLAKIKWTS